MEEAGVVRHGGWKKASLLVITRWITENDWNKNLEDFEGLD
jgi:hypothetical protein